MTCHMHVDKDYIVDPTFRSAIKKLSTKPNILPILHLAPKLIEGSDIGEWSTELVADPANDPSYLVGEDPIKRVKKLKK